MVKKGKAKSQLVGALKVKEFVGQDTGGVKNAKKQANTPRKMAPPMKHVEEEDSDDIEEDSGADVKAEQDSDSEHDNELDGDEESDDEDLSEAESGEEEAEDDDDDDDDEEEDESEVTNIPKVQKGKRSATAEDSDEEPSEEPILKKATNSTVKNKLKYAMISPLIPSNRIIFVGSVKSATQPHELTEVFAKYGDIVGMSMNGRGKFGKVQIAFETAEAAKAALAANGEANINGSTLHVTPKNEKKGEQDKATREAEKDRTVMVTSLRRGTTEEQLREHFDSCGTIININPNVAKSTFVFIVFAEKAQAVAAKKLNYSELNGITIHVKLLDGDNHDVYQKELGRTIIMNNTANLDAFPLAKLQSIFEKCGEIEFTEIICKRKVLAFITFKEEKAATKALKLNGSTVGGLEVSLEKYIGVLEKPKTTIFVQNVKPGVTEEEVRELFGKCGEIESIFMKAGFCTVRFKEQESFCKSFLLNESTLHNQLIFIEPYSDKKQTVLKKMQNKSHQPQQRFNQQKPYPQKKPFQKFQGPRDQEPNRKRPMYAGKGMNPKKPRNNFAN